MPKKKPDYCCATLADQIVDVNGHGVGLHGLQVMNVKTLKMRIAGVFNRAHRKRGKGDNGLCLNFCPWCGTDLVKFYDLKTKSERAAERKS